MCDTRLWCVSSQSGEDVSDHVSGQRGVSRRGRMAHGSLFIHIKFFVVFVADVMWICVSLGSLQSGGDHHPR